VRWGNFIQRYWGSILQFAVTAICAAAPACEPFLSVVAGLTSAFVTGVTSGNLGLALRAGFITAVTVGIVQYAQQLAANFGGALATEGGTAAADGSESWPYGPPMHATGSGGVEGEAFVEVPGEEGRHAFLVMDRNVDQAVNAPAPTAISPAAVGAPSAMSYINTYLNDETLAATGLTWVERQNRDALVPWLLCSSPSGPRGNAHP
jgi:hypothetical protein